ncbi:fimbrial biogenesis chaperone, partial [Salmonella enterica subsp. enterica serovar Pomona]
VRLNSVIITFSGFKSGTCQRYSGRVSQKVKAPRYVAPFGNAQYTLPAAASGPIAWSIINDFGGTGPEHKQTP